MSQLNGDELKKLIESNARSIEALSSSLAESQRKAEQEMAALRDTLGHVARTQSNAIANLNHALADVVQKQGETNAQTYQLINRLEGRQGEIVEIMKLLVEKVGESKS